MTAIAKPSALQSWIKPHQKLKSSSLSPIKYMFLSELTPALQQLVQQPIAFAGGFASGILQLKLNEEPLSKWLEQQGIYPPSNYNSSSPNNSNKPKSIDID